MTDVPTTGEASAPGQRRRVPRWTWWVIGGTVAASLCVISALWFFAGTKTWTDGGALRVADHDTRVRQIVWTKPKPLDGFSSDEQVYEPSISPDGTELYFVRGKAGKGAHIYVSHRRHNAWSKAEPVEAVNGQFDSLGPRLTPDGSFLLFYSDRPGGFGGYDIWVVRRTEDGWGTPFNLGPNVNSEFNEFNPDPTPDGLHLVFATNRKAAKREQNEAWRSTIRETVSADYDLWIADAEPFNLAGPATQPSTQPTTQPPTEPSEIVPVRLAFRPAHEIPGVNTEYTEGASCMSPAGDFLYFASNRPDGSGKFDIYRCRVHGDRFEFPENVGPPINTAENEADPALAYNGFKMIFSSDRPGADGRYYLLVSDSREVYPERVGRPFPHLGLSAWLLLISALVLIPLLMFLRGWEDHRLNTIQKCLLLSLLVHALITFAMSFVVVTQQVSRYVRQQAGLEVAVNLAEGQGVEEVLAVRGNISGDLPVAGAAPASLDQTKLPAEPLAAPEPVQVSVPGAKLASVSGLTLPAQTPHAAAPPPSQTVDVQSPVTANQTIDVKLPAAATVSQPEAQPQVAAAAANLAKMALANDPASPSASPGQITLPVAAGNAAGSGASGLTAAAPPAHAASTTLAKADALPSGSSNSTVLEPQIAPALSAARQKATEPAPMARAASELASSTGRLQEAGERAAGGAGPADIPITPGPVANKSGPIDLTVDPFPSTATVAGRLGSTLGSGPSPTAPGGQAVAGPQLAQAASGSPSRQHGTEAIPDASAANAVGPTTRPVAIASGAGQASSSPAQIALPAGAATVPGKASSSLAVAAPAARTGAIGSNITSPVAASLQVTGAPAPQLTGTGMKLTQAPPTPENAMGGRGAPDQTPAVARQSVGGASTAGPSTVALGPAPIAAAGGSTLSAPGSSTGRPQVANAPAGAPAASVKVAADAVAGPQIAVPAPRASQAKVAIASGEKPLTGSAVAAAPNRAATGTSFGGPNAIDLGTAPAQASGRIAGRNKGPDIGGIGPHPAQLVAATIAPEISLSPLAGALGTKNLTSPETPFMRAPEQRKTLLEELGGTKQSEDAVARGLAYLARVQEPDGRWTRIEDDRVDVRRPHDRHDTANSAFALLAFLAQDHTPDAPGPYREVVSKAVDYLISQRDDNGDLRGRPEFRGGGSDAANMYDQGIATYALAECAIMTHDPRTIDAALKGAQFIVRAQDPNSGGWRYSPNEYGDSSVFGWQVMALHSAQQVGFQVPAETLAGARRYIESCAEGRHGLLAGYQPHTGATPPMTAELLFSRMLLDMPLDEDGIDESTRFLARDPPDVRNANLYYWYYASLSMLHMRNKLWKDWNVLTRESLIRTQQLDGPAAGSWEIDRQWGSRGGRVFQTALATLTLEIYYRYLPMRKLAETRQGESPQQ